MHHLRDSLLSPSPEGPHELNHLDARAKDALSVREAVARGEFEELRGAAFYNRTGVVSDRYCSLGDGIDSLVHHIHSAWHMYYQLAVHTAHDTYDQDRLVLDIVRIQGLGPLVRPVTGQYGVDIARTVDGTVWNDLPFLATDMTEFWIDNCATLKNAQRLNLASFLAKLASTRVCKDRISQIGLVLLSSTFEERRGIEGGDPDELASHQFISTLDYTQLMPAVLAWVKEAGHVLVQLSDVSWNDCPSKIGQGGHNFLASEFGKRAPTGFTPWRWMYWLKRLHEIRQEAKEANEKTLEEQTAEAIDRMVAQVHDRNSGILRVYQDGGDFLKQDDHLSCLKGK
ncbi:cytochrome P450 [Pyrenophora seminiperda CCB06]|uniref:Cytochrome P450 n=1 Tax=Pyrenophora seminiperda CCB06 TaxID=1302712 RepID=A0A3M7MJ54_9PLEO|nr:cytochrome P450 [Pyrenophora seminiperda CCB06]